MTQGSDGISLAPGGARRLMGVARRLSVVVAVFALAAIFAGTAGTSYAGSKKDAHHHKSTTPVLLDTVRVTNYGAAFGGSLATFSAGEGRDDAPTQLVKGTNTLLGDGTGPAGVSVSSLDDHIGVTVPIDLIDLTGFGGFPSALACTGAGTPVPCCTGFHKGVCEAGTGFAALFSQGATGNSAPESLIGTPNVTLSNVFLGCSAPGVPFPCCSGPNAGTCDLNTSGVNTSQGLAFEDPFDDANPGRDIVAIANTLPINFFSTTDLTDGTNGGAACNAFGSGTCTGIGTPQACCTGPGTGTCAGFVVGDIAEFDIKNQIKPGTNSIAPFNNNPVCELPAAAIPPLFSSPPTSCPVGSINNTTIGGCLTFLLGPVALAWDQTGFLFAVNEAGVASGGPGFVTVYQPGAAGDVFPTAVVGLVPPTAGAFVDPGKITVYSPDSNFNDDIIFVTDVGDNSIKIFAPFTSGCGEFPNFFCAGTELGVIHGGSTKLKRPLGLAVDSVTGTLYVVNHFGNSLEMFTDIESDTGGGDIPPTLIVKGRSTKLNFPVDVALPAFTPSSRPTEAASSN